MDTDTYLLNRRTIEDRLAVHRLQLSPSVEPGVRPSVPFSWRSFATQWVVREMGWSSLVGGLVTAGAGVLISRLKSHGRH